AMPLRTELNLHTAIKPTTAIDVTIQGQILSYVQRLCRENNTALIWITHDLGVVAELADRVAVMYAGRIVETGSISDVLDRPVHPYTLGLLQSMPSYSTPGQRLQQIDGMAPTLAKRPIGCAFRTRCQRAVAQCSTHSPD